MRAIGVALLAAVAACYSPSYVDCMITCTSGSCPSGFVCDQGVCRSPGATQPCGATADASPNDGSTDGPTVDGPPGDVDADGIPNASDNCPNRHNPNQANEDGDMFGDVCDPCPPFAAAADNMDSDQDGVGDSCDPSPSVPGNSIAIFTGFADTMAPTGSMPAGTWMFANGRAVLSASTTMGVAEMLVWPQPAGDSQTVMARFTVIGMNTPPAAFGVVNQVDTTVNPFSAIACWIMKPDAASNGDLSLMHVNGQQIGQSTPNALVINRTYRTDLTRRNNTSYSCSESTVTTPLSGQAMIPATMPLIGLMSVGVSASVEWVLVVSGP